MAINEIKIEVDTSTVALGLLDAEVLLAIARRDAAEEALRVIRSRRNRLADLIREASDDAPDDELAPSLDGLEGHGA